MRALFGSQGSASSRPGCGRSGTKVGHWIEKTFAVPRPTDPWDSCRRGPGSRGLGERLAFTASRPLWMKKPEFRLQQMHQSNSAM